MASRDRILVSRTLYQIGYVTLLASVIWVVVGIATASSKNYTLDIDDSILEPIDPHLDQEIIKAMSSRTKIEDILVNELANSSLSTESATIEEGTGR